VHEHNKTIDLHAAVVMPDHIHLIFTPLVGPDLWTFTLPQIMRAIKGRAARKVNVFLNRRGPVWQDESFDHVLRSNESLAQKMDYVCRILLGPDWLVRTTNISGFGRERFRCYKLRPFQAA
jgi:REP element-mobilizing transposase RayT